MPFWNRGLGLDPTAAPEFTHTPGQVAFSPDGSQLLVTTKASTNAIDVFGDRPARAARRRHPVVNVEAGAVPFAVAFDRRGNLAVAEAGPNAVATFDLHRNGTLTALDAAATGQAATCWIVYANGTFYASNAGSGTVSGYHAGAGGKLTALGNTAPMRALSTPPPARRPSPLRADRRQRASSTPIRINANGSLTAAGSVTVAGTAGGEGIAAG